MTLLICVFAAIFATVKWYQRKDDSLMPGVPCVLFWGASLMWLGDAIFGYIEDGAAFFEPEAAEMLNDAYLGLSVVALGLILWLVILLVKDPKGIVKAGLKKKAAK
ncbi:MAG: hypothetical protein IKO83_00200 [Oscillospiraceae bacterium]|nr:hypothetical protein [Oscillospiraceae bacterium]